MLDAFLVANRDAIIDRTRTRIAARAGLPPSAEELDSGVPKFLDQLGAALALAKVSDLVDHVQLEKSASLHGKELQRMGLTIGGVVGDYGHVCQAITELAREHSLSFPASEFRTLNLCLDHAIAAAVTEFSRQEDRVAAGEGAEQKGILAHEMRNLLSTAVLAFEVLKGGHVGVGGSTGRLLERSLLGLRDLVDRSLDEVRIDARGRRIVVGELVEDVRLSAAIDAETRGVHFTVSASGPSAVVEGDGPILAAALANLLQNAFKFTRKGGHVSLTTRVTEDRVTFAIEDECGGLPEGKVAELFLPYEQRSADRTGVGLGLSICEKAATAHRGQIHVRDLPGKGCVFTLDLPRALDDL